MTAAGESLMIEEHRKVYRMSLAIVLAAAVIAVPLDRTVACSLVLGIALYGAYLVVLAKTVALQLEGGFGAGPLLYLGFVLRVAVLALPLVAAVRHPEHLSLLAACVPLFVGHLVTFALYGRKEAAA